MYKFLISGMVLFMKVMKKRSWKSTSHVHWTAFIKITWRNIPWHGI